MKSKSPKKSLNKRKNKKNKININKKWLIFIIILIIILVGTTYAYFLIQKNTEFGEIISGNMAISYTNGEELLLTNATPIYEKYVDTDASYSIFSIKNNGNVNMYTDISLENIVLDDSLKTNDFKWKIEQGSNATKEGFNDSFIIEQGTFEDIVSTSKILAMNRYIEPGETKYYKVSVWVQETGENQNAIMGTSFKAKIRATGYAKNQSRTFAGITPIITNTSAGRTISNLKLYGNSVQKTTPTPESPVEIQSVGEKRNLFDGIWEQGHSQSSELNNTRIRIKNLIRCKNGVKYTLTHKLKQGYQIQIATTTDSSYPIDSLSYDSYWQTSRITFTSSIDGYIEMMISKTDGTKITPEEAKDFEIMLEEGYATEEFEPYGKYVIPISVSGKNLFNIDSFTKSKSIFVSGWNSTSTTWYTKTDDDVIISNKGMASEMALFNSNINSLEPGKYTLSAEFYLPSATYLNGGTIYIGLRDTGSNIWSHYKNTTISKADTWERISYSFTLNETTEIQGLFMQASGLGNQTSNLGLQIKNIMLEQNDSMTEYEEYKGKTYKVYLDEPLRAFGKVQDYIDFENKQVVRKILKYSYTGEESSWAARSGFTNTFNLPTGTIIMDGTCSHYKTINNNYYFDKENMIYLAYTNSIIIADLRYNNVTDFKEFLKSEYKKGTPLTIITYDRDNTTTTEKIDLPSIKTIGGTNIIRTNSIINGSFSGTH